MAQPGHGAMLVMYIGFTMSLLTPMGSAPFYAGVILMVVGLIVGSSRRRATLEATLDHLREAVNAEHERAAVAEVKTALLVTELERLASRVPDTPWRHICDDMDDRTRQAFGVPEARLVQPNPNAPARLLPRSAILPSVTGYATAVGAGGVSKSTALGVCPQCDQPGIEVAVETNYGPQIVGWWCDNCKIRTDNPRWESNGGNRAG